MDIVGFFSPSSATDMEKLNEGFKTWLKTLGFAESSVKSFPNYTAEMLAWMEKKGKAITGETIGEFFFHWKNRKNKRTGAGLSQAHINKGTTALNNFIKFLGLTGKQQIDLKLGREKAPQKLPQVLTVREIQALHGATYDNTKRTDAEAFGQRDRAMLAVFYGCGLRKNEGNNLLVSDVLMEKRLLYVRKGKGGKERIVPIAGQGLRDIEEYLQDGRKWFLGQRQATSDSFFVNIQGSPMRDFSARIKALKEEAGVQKQISLHTFRHSIATHLLRGGMDMEQIKKFLGHASLESTQLYTHIINENGF